MSDERPVERVAVGTRQSAGARSVSHRYCQLVKALTGYGAGNVKSDRLHARDFADTILYSDLPSRCGADQLFVRFIDYRTPDGLRQPFAS